MIAAAPAAPGAASAAAVPSAAANGTAATPAAAGGGAAAAAAAADAAPPPPSPNTAAASLLRFEDLTVDDDLPPVERVVRYVRSGIALQRLVHVKMLGEAARIGGTAATMDILLPLLPPLVADPESIIRQHLASQLLPLGLTCMYDCPPGQTVLADVLNAAAKTPTTNDYPTGKLNGVLGGGGKASERPYHPAGYKVLTGQLIPQLTSLIGDPDVDVRRSASDSLASLGMHIRPSDVEGLLLPAALRLSRSGTGGAEGGDSIGGGSDGAESEGEAQTQAAEDLRITSSNLLADLASLPPPRMTPDLVSRRIVPAVLTLCSSSSSPSSESSSPTAAATANGFRVRRSAVQALPRVLASCPEADARDRVLPAFDALSRDDMYRVRKSAGECLVDMSRSLMLAPMNALRCSAGGVVGPVDIDRDVGDIPLQAAEDAAEDMAERMRRLRRVHLLPVAVRLLSDPNKFVRHGMMQFLGPFMASFYPLEGGGPAGTPAGAANGGVGGDGKKMSVMDLLESECYGDGSDGEASAGSTPSGSPATQQVGGVGVQFFPHANGMVSRLNPSDAAAAALAGAQQQKPAPGADGGAAAAASEAEELRTLLSRLPTSLLRSRRDATVLDSILNTRSAHPPQPDDLAAVRAHLLPHFVGLSEVDSGDENVDAEMRVYCAYSLPAVVLLLGREGWDPPLKKCFLNLVMGTAAAEVELGEAKVEEGAAPVVGADVPLPVKRCLASSFHTVCHVLGRDVAFGSGVGTAADEKPVMLRIFEERFLRDTDDTVRLNVLRNLPHLLGLMSPSTRSSYLPRLHELFLGDDLLGAARRRSATSPMLLNWRQRDAVAQILPDLAGLFGPGEVRRYVWPVAKALLGDKISAVREDVEWCLPAVLRRYAPEHCRDPEAIAAYQEAVEGGGGAGGGESGDGADDGVDDENDPFAAPKPQVDPKVWSAEACDEVISYLKTALLLEPAAAGRHGDVHETARGRADRNCGAFTKRQEYCRICGILGTALRLGELDQGMRRGGGEGDSATTKSSRKSRSGKSRHRHEEEEDVAGFMSTPLSSARHAFADLSSGERRLLRRLLVRCFLPDALHMRDDRVSNVRLTLMGALRAQPPDVRDDPRVVEVLTTLEEEVHTWEGGWENDAMWGAASMGAPADAATAGGSTAASTVPSSSATMSSRTANGSGGAGGDSVGTAGSASRDGTAASAASAQGDGAGRLEESGAKSGSAMESDGSGAGSKIVGRVPPLSLQGFSQQQPGAPPPPTSPAASSIDGESSLASI